MRVTSKGQVTIPSHLRQAAGLLPGTEIDIRQEGATIRIVARSAESSSCGHRLVEGLRGRGDLPVRTDEVMTLTRGG